MAQLVVKLGFRGIYGIGFIAAGAGKPLGLTVCKSSDGWFIGTSSIKGIFSRESVELYPSEGVAQSALEQDDWTQRRFRGIGGIGLKAKRVAGLEIELQIWQSQAGYYIGCWTEEGPYSRESVEYFRTEKAAQRALETDNWTQCSHW